MNYLGKVTWIELRPNQEEAAVKLCGVRADHQSGIRMEVRILNTVEHGAHVSVTVADKSHLLLIKAQILITHAVSYEQTLEEGKRRAIIFANAYLGALTKN